MLLQHVPMLILTLIRISIMALWDQAILTLTRVTQFFRLSFMAGKILRKARSQTIQLFSGSMVGQVHLHSLETCSNADHIVLLQPTWSHTTSRKTTTHGPKTTMWSLLINRSEQVWDLLIKLWRTYTAPTWHVWLMTSITLWKSCSKTHQDASVFWSSSQVIRLSFSDKVMPVSTLQPLEKRFWEKLRIITAPSQAWRVLPLETVLPIPQLFCHKLENMPTILVFWTISNVLPLNKLSWTELSKTEENFGETCTIPSTRLWTLLLNGPEELTSMISLNTEDIPILSLTSILATSMSKLCMVWGKISPSTNKRVMFMKPCTLTLWCHMFIWLKSCWEETVKFLFTMDKMILLSKLRVLSSGQKEFTMLMLRNSGNLKN